MDTSSADTGSSQTMNLGSQRQGAGDADALAAAAVQLVGIGCCIAGAPGPPCPSARQHGRRSPSCWAALVDDHGLRDDLADRHSGVQGGIGVLEDDLHLLAQLLHLPGLYLMMSSPVVENLARGGLDAGAAWSGPGWTCRSRTRPPRRGSVPPQSSGSRRPPRGAGPADVEIFFQVSVSSRCVSVFMPAPPSFLESDGSGS